MTLNYLSYYNVSQEILESISESPAQMPTLLSLLPSSLFF